MDMYYVRNDSNLENSAFAERMPTYNVECNIR
jgi:hypothetical protein